MPYRIYTLAERPELGQPISDIHNAVWPRFMQQSEVSNKAWPLLFEAWPQFQVALCDSSDTPLAAGHAMPLRWDGTVEGLPEGWDAATEMAMRGLENEETPDTLSAYAIVVAPNQQGSGHSSTVLNALHQAGIAQGLQSLIACVRPTLKARYPLTPFSRYVEWKREDGAPFDPWMRVHWRAGAKQATPSAYAMTITGSIAEWQEWTGLTFPDSGPYVVEGALQPVQIDVEADRGTYHDPNVWMIHRLASTQD